MSTIIVKDFTWRQTSSEVIIYVPFKGSTRNVDLFITDNYVKANCPPFILELFLYTKIIENEAKCIVRDQDAIFSLKKAEPGIIWPSLELSNLNKEDKQKLREQVWVCGRSSILNCAKNKAENRHSLQKEAVKTQINIDTATLDAIKEIRDECRQSVLQNLNDWTGEAGPSLDSLQDHTDVRDSPINNSQRCICNYESGESRNEQQLKNVLPTTKHVLDCQSIAHTQDTSNTVDVIEKKTALKGQLTERLSKCQYFYPRGTSGHKNDIDKIVPRPRKNGAIDVKFSERAFATPARESAYTVEQEGGLWLTKRVEATRSSGFTAEDFRQDEKDPQWLKDKGDEFFKADNYLAAISAYTLGIRINSKMVSLHLNRSAAYYALENYDDCIKDCSNALNLMEPQCESNRESRARCHARRGVSLCKLSDFEQGLLELETAFKLSKCNESIKRDLSAARQIFRLKKGNKAKVQMNATNTDS